MKKSAWIVTLLAVFLCLGAFAAYAQDGTITGTIKYAGVPPERRQVDITKDKDVCGKNPHYMQSLIVGSGGGIKNVVVYIAGVKAETKPETVVFDQKGCEYEPHVLAFPAGSTIRIRNDDGILHNIHTYSTKNPPINMAQPGFKKVMEVKIEKPEIIHVTCDAHSWMHGWWFAAANPYYAVTDAKGDYTIKNVPAGDYTVTIWQEILGKEERKVTVKPGAATTLDVTMKPKA